MTRKDYELVAEAIKSGMRFYGKKNPSGRNMAVEIAATFASKALEENPRFDATKFYFACGL